MITFYKKLYGNVDDFWISKFGSLTKVPWLDFAEAFLHYFNHDKNEDDKTAEVDTITEKLELDPEKPKVKFDDEVRWLIGLKHLLRTTVPIKKDDQEFVTRDNYSLVYSLMRFIFYDSKVGTDNVKSAEAPRDFHDPSFKQFIEDLYYKVNYWYGFLSNDDAQELIANHVLHSYNKCWYLVYAPTDERGKFKMILKLSKEANVLTWGKEALKLGLKRRNTKGGKRILTSDSWDAREFDQILAKVDTEIDKFEKEDEFKKYKISFPTVAEINTFSNPGMTINIVPMPTYYVSYSEPSDMKKKAEEGDKKEDKKENK